MTPARRASAKSRVIVASGPIIRSTEECEMSRSCQSATFSIAGVTAERTMRARPVRFSVSTGLRLCGIARGALLAFGEIFLRLQHFGALQMADLGREPLDRGGDDAERGEKRGVPVARDHLRRDRLDFQAELLRHMLLDARIDVGEGADRAGNRAGRNLLARRDEPRAGAREFGIGQRELEPEGRGLGMDAVRAADGRRHLVLEGAPLQRREQRVDVGDEDVAGALKLHREAGVEHVRARHALMDEARRRGR